MTPSLRSFSDQFGFLFLEYTAPAASCVIYAVTLCLRLQWYAAHVGEYTALVQNCTHHHVVPAPMVKIVAFSLPWRQSWAQHRYALLRTSRQLPQSLVLHLQLSARRLQRSLRPHLSLGTSRLCQLGTQHQHWSLSISRLHQWGTLQLHLSMSTLHLRQLGTQHLHQLLHKLALLANRGRSTSTRR